MASQPGGVLQPPQGFQSPSPGLPKAVGSAAEPEQQFCSFSPGLLFIYRELLDTQMCCRQNLCVLRGEEGEAVRGVSAQADEVL